MSNAEAVIGRLGKAGSKLGLCQNYFQNFGANNKGFRNRRGKRCERDYLDHSSRTDHTEPFRPWPDVVANSTFMCNAWIGDAPAMPTSLTIAEYNSGKGWKCMVTRRNLLRNSTGMPITLCLPDKRVQFGRQKMIRTQNKSLMRRLTGVAMVTLAVKYSNWADWTIMA